MMRLGALFLAAATLNDGQHGVADLGFETSYAGVLRALARL